MDRGPARAGKSTGCATLTNVRDLTAADLDDLVALQLPCFGTEAWTRSMVGEELSRPGAVLLGVSAPVEAFVFAYVAVEELHLLQIATAPHARRKGLGAALLTELVRRTQHSVSTGWLEVRGDNGPARALYAALSWEEVSVRRRYYADGCDAVVYRYTLRP